MEKLKYSGITVCVLLILSLFSACAKKETTTGGGGQEPQQEETKAGKIIGTVSHTEAMDGGVIQNANIQAGQKNAYTNSNGYYELELSPGNYSVTASKDGYESKSTAASVADKSTTICNFTLKKYTSPNYQIQIENYRRIQSGLGFYGYASGTVKNTGDCPLRSVSISVTFIWKWSVSSPAPKQYVTTFIEKLGVGEKIPWEVTTTTIYASVSIYEVTAVVTDYSYDALLAPSQNK